MKDLKTRLEQLNKEMKDFEITLKQSKLINLHKDIKNFSHEKVYPFINKTVRTNERGTDPE